MNIDKELTSGTFHIRMMKYLQLSTTEEEWVDLDDNEILGLEFEGYGRYTITFLDLKLKADEETLQLKEKYKHLNDIKIEQDDEETDN